MLFMSLTGRLQTAKAFALHDASRFAGVVSWVPRARKTPSSTVSLRAVKVALAIGRDVRVRFRNRNLLRERAGSASEMRSESVRLWAGCRSGRPLVSESGFEL